MQTDAVKSCNYCGRYDNSVVACYKKQADEARARAQIQNTQKVQILKKGAAAPVEQKEKAIMYVQEAVSEQEDDKVLMIRFAFGEPAQKQVRFEETTGQVQDQGQVLGAARVRRRPVFTPKEKPHRKRGLKKKDTNQKSAIQARDERAERYDFLNSLVRASAGIKFGQIANGDVDKVRKELRKIMVKKVTRSTVNVTSEDGQRRVPPNCHHELSCRCTPNRCTDFWT